MMTGGNGESPTIDDVRERCAGAFRERLGGEPAWGAAAPGRVNLIGEHTDYNGGLVLPIAIERWCVAVGAQARVAERSRLLASDLGEMVEIDLRGPVAPVHGIARAVEGGRVRVGSWASYVIGVAAKLAECCGRSGGPARNVDIAVSSSVPLGSGLSSSASLEVAVATLLESAWGMRLEPVETARLCRAAEHEFAGVPCGIMDQFISAMGREGHALLIDCRDERAEPVPMPPPARAVLVVMNTGVHHELAGGEYAKRRDTCAGAAANLGVRELRDATMELIESAKGRLAEIELRRARHVVTENQRVITAVAALRAGDLVAFGRLMSESHASLRDDYEVSCPELDTLVELAGSVPGVFGARMTGGGFGGCAIALVEPASGDRLVEAVRGGYTARFGRAPSLFATRATGGASMVGGWR
jgi:galactokinase